MTRIFNKEKIRKVFEEKVSVYVGNISFKEDGDSMYVEYDMDDTPEHTSIFWSNHIGPTTVGLTINLDGRVTKAHIVKYDHFDVDKLLRTGINEGAFEEDEFKDLDEFVHFIETNNSDSFENMVMGDDGLFYSGFRGCVLDVPELCKTFNSESDNNVVIDSHKCEYGKNETTLEFEVYVNDELLSDTFISYDLYSEEYSITVNNKEYAKGSDAKSLFTNFCNALNEYSLDELHKKYSKEVVSLYTATKDFADKLQEFKVKEDLKDFIYKIDDSPKLKVESSYDSIDEFFDDCISNSNASDFDELIICAVDTRQPIIKIQKTVKEDKTDFKFIVDITTEDGDSFVIKTTIKSKEQLNSKIQETVESLRAQKEFSKYADDLEACL